MPEIFLAASPKRSITRSVKEGGPSDDVLKFFALPHGMIHPQNDAGQHTQYTKEHQELLSPELEINLSPSYEQKKLSCGV
jgi:hypothetical protein